MANAILLTNLVNIKYLTGFHSSHALLLQAGKNFYVFTDGRYLEKAEAIGKRGQGRVGRFNVIDMGKDFKENWRKILKRHHITAIEFEANDLTVERFDGFKKLGKGTKWKSGAKGVWKKRMQKDKAEMLKLKKSQEINEQIFYSVKRALKPGITEIEIAELIKEQCPRHGSEGISFEPIVAFGNHSSMPHHENTNRKLKKGVPILIDMGVLYQGYASDMTRMVFTKTPTQKEEALYNAVLKAQEAAIQKMKPGAKTYTLDHIARKTLGDYEPYFTHALGHGIGLEVHEPPTLSNKSKDTLKSGMVVTSEPGVYLPGKWGVRIEDMILITANGHQNLTHVPKEIKDCILSLS